MTDRVGSNFCGSLVERVDETDVAVAAEAECMRNIFLDQIVNDNLAAVHPSQSITPLGRLNLYPTCTRDRLARNIRCGL